MTEIDIQVPVQEQTLNAAKSVKAEMKLNIGVTVLGFISLTISGAIGWSNLTHDVGNLRQDLNEDRASYAAKFSSIDARIEPFTEMQFRVAGSEASIKALNDRLDRGFDNIVSSTDALRKEIGALSVNVSLLSQRLDFVDSKVPGHPGSRVTN